MEHSRTLALLRWIERGCTQFVQSERIPAREAAVLGEEPMPESTQPMAEEQPRLQRNEGRATMDVVSQQTEEMPWQEAHEEVQEEDAVREEQQEAPFDLLDGDGRGGRGEHPRRTTIASRRWPRAAAELAWHGTSCRLLSARSTSLLKTCRA